MATYNLFKFKIKPAPYNSLYAKVSCGSVVVEVDETSPEIALKRAVYYVSQEHWEIIETMVFPQFEDEIQSEFPELDNMHMLAKTKGIGAAYYIGIGGGTLFN